MKFRRLTLSMALAAVVAVAGCTWQVDSEEEPPAEPTPPPEERPLAATEIRETLSGNSLYRQFDEALRTYHFASFHRRNGTMTGRVWRKATVEESAQGNWEVTDEGLYCRQWENQWGEGEHGCFRVIRFGEEIVFEATGGEDSDSAEAEPERFIYRVLIGNNYNL